MGWGGMRWGLRLLPRRHRRASIGLLGLLGPLCHAAVCWAPVCAPVMPWHHDGITAQRSAPQHTTENYTYAVCSCHADGFSFLMHACILGHCTHASATAHVHPCTASLYCTAADHHALHVVCLYTRVLGCCCCGALPHAAACVPHLNACVNAASAGSLCNPKGQVHPHKTTKPTAASSCSHVCSHVCSLYCRARSEGP